MLRKLRGDNGVPYKAITRMFDASSPKDASRSNAVQYRTFENGRKMPVHKPSLQLRLPSHCIHPHEPPYTTFYLQPPGKHTPSVPHILGSDPAYRHYKMAESFGFQAEISQLLDLIISEYLYPCGEASYRV